MLSAYLVCKGDKQLCKWILGSGGRTVFKAEDEDIEGII